MRLIRHHNPKTGETVYKDIDNTIETQEIIVLIQETKDDELKQWRGDIVEIDSDENWLITELPNVPKLDNCDYDEGVNHPKVKVFTHSIRTKKIEAYNIKIMCDTRKIKKIMEGKKKLTKISE